jgi:hypothetical protein
MISSSRRAVEFLELSNPNAKPRFFRLLRAFKYLAVPSGLVSCCKYLLLPPL